MKPLDIPVLHGASGDAPDELDTLQTARGIREVLVRAGHRSELVHVRRDLGALRDLEGARPDLVFNLVESVAGDSVEAIKVPAMLARAGLTFTGCGSRASQDCASKPGMKRIMRANGLPTPDWSLTGKELAHLSRVIVKASHEHASIGMDTGSVVSGYCVAREIEMRTDRFATPFFVEKYIEGREFNLSLLANGATVEVLPPAEINFVGYPRDLPRIVDYATKWVEGSFGYANTPRSFDFGEEDFLLLDEMKKLALRCWRVFGLSGYARVDFRVDRRGRPWILEVNTNPCLAADAGFAAAANCAGISYPQLISRIIAVALIGKKAIHDTY